ncbi:MAG: single-stranded DNA-binding protein [Deltaproteobacteria bacterium]|nr:single-stranded DNA-binding protein [Deltaproteobacteria bacterium]
MASLNKVMLIGNLGKDPELRYTPDGLAILKFSIATSEYYNDKSGNKTEKTTWHNVVVFGKIAQTLANYLNKGKQVFVEGRINNRSYDKQDGTKGYISEVIANNIVLLGAKGGGGGAEAADADYGQVSNDYGYAAQNSGSSYGAGSANTGGASSQPGEDDDIPF